MSKICGSGEVFAVMRKRRIFTSVCVQQDWLWKINKYSNENGVQTQSNDKKIVCVHKCNAAKPLYTMCALDEIGFRIAMHTVWLNYQNFSHFFPASLKLTWMVFLGVMRTG